MRPVTRAMRKQASLNLDPRGQEALEKLLSDSRSSLSPSTERSIEGERPLPPGEKFDTLAQMDEPLVHRYEVIDGVKKFLEPKSYRQNQLVNRLGQVLMLTLSVDVMFNSSHQVETPESGEPSSTKPCVRLPDLAFIFDSNETLEGDENLLGNSTPADDRIRSHERAGNRRDHVVTFTLEDKADVVVHFTNEQTRESDMTCKWVEYALTGISMYVIIDSSDVSDDGHAHVIVGLLRRPSRCLSFRRLTAFDEAVEQQRYDSFCKSFAAQHSKVYYKFKFTGGDKVDIGILKKLDMTASEFQNPTSLLDKIKKYRDSPVGLGLDDWKIYKELVFDLIAKHRKELSSKCEIQSSSARERETRATTSNRSKLKPQSDSGVMGEFVERATAVRDDVSGMVDLCKEYTKSAQRYLRKAERERKYAKTHRSRCEYLRKLAIEAVEATKQWRNAAKDYKKSAQDYYESAHDYRQSAERLRGIANETFQRAESRRRENDEIQRETTERMEVSLYALSKVAQSSAQNQEIVNLLNENWPHGSVGERMEAVDGVFDSQIQPVSVNPPVPEAQPFSSTQAVADNDAVADDQSVSEARAVSDAQVVDSQTISDVREASNDQADEDAQLGGSAQRGSGIQSGSEVQSIESAHFGVVGEMSGKSRDVRRRSARLQDVSRSRLSRGTTGNIREIASKRSNSAPADVRADDAGRPRRRRRT